MYIIYYYFDQILMLLYYNSEYKHKLSTYKTNC